MRDDEPDEQRSIGSQGVTSRSGILFCVGVYVVARVTLSLLAVITVRDAPPLQADGFPSAGIMRPVEAGWHNLFEGPYRWDAGWFVSIAERGYGADDGSAEFYPGFPLVARAVANVTPLGPLGAALVVANVAFLAGLILLFFLTALEFDERVARRTIILLAVYPASFVFMAPFSEALFLPTTVAAFYFARTDRWAWSAGMGVVATATRATGLFLIPSLGIEAMGGDRAGRNRRLIAAAIPVSGFIAYLAYWAVRAGDPFVPLRAPALWDRTTQFPLTMVGRAIETGIAGIFDTAGILWTMDLVLTALVLVPLIVWWRLLRPSYLLYAALTFVVVITVTYAPRPLVGAPRYAAVLFPAFWLLAARLERRAFIVLTACFICGYLIIASAFMRQGLFIF